jgi:hypothetical protein
MAMYDETEMDMTLAQTTAEDAEKKKNQKNSGKENDESGDVKTKKDEKETSDDAKNTKNAKEDMSAEEEDPNKSGFLAKAGIAGAIAVGATVGGAVYTRHKMQKGVDNLSNDIGGALFGKDLRRLPDISGITGIGDKDHQEYEY